MTTFAEGRERTKALGIWSAIAAGGGAVGLILGGLLTETLSWRWVFFVNLPIGIAAALLSLRFIPNSRAEEKPETADVAGAVTVTGGLLVLVYAIVKTQDYGWASGRTLGLFALAAALLGSFVAIELRSKSPLIRLGIFRMRSLTTSNIVDAARRRRGCSRCSTSPPCTSRRFSATGRSRQASRFSRSRSGSSSAPAPPSR